MNSESSVSKLKGGDKIELKWPLDDGRLKTFMATVRNVKKAKEKNGSLFKYKILFDDGDKRTTRLKDGEYKILKTEKKRKLASSTNLTNKKDNKRRKISTEDEVGVAAVNEVSSELEEVKRQIVEVKRKLERAETRLEKAEEDANEENINFYRETVIQLRRELVELRIEKNKLIPESTDTPEKEKFTFEISPTEISPGKGKSIPGEHLIVKKLPESLSERYGIIPEVVYVRECYRELYEAAANSMDPDPKQRSATLFTGVPGIGKSLFLVYFIYRFLNDERFPDKRFALEFDRGKYLYFEPTGVEGEFLKSTVDARNMRDKKFLLLCDMTAQEEPASRFLWTFIFSSPSTARYKETIKNDPNDQFILPTWSALELCFVNGNFNSWQEKFDKFGGVPRYVFGKKSDKRMKDAIAAKGGIVAERFFKTGYGMEDSTQSYMIVHINPPWSAEYGFIYDGATEYSFASTYVFNEMVSKHNKQMLAGARGLFNVGVASETYGAVSAGNLFEKICLCLKPVDGQRLTCISLKDNSNHKDFEVPSERKFLSLDWRKTASLVPGVFYVPRTSNMKSSDSFFLVRMSSSRYMLVVLQMTVGKNHPVMTSGLNDIFRAFPEDVRKKIFEKALIFVTPLNCALDKEQKLTNADVNQTETTKFPKAVKGFKQFVCRYKI